MIPSLRARSGQIAFLLTLLLSTTSCSVFSQALNTSSVQDPVPDNIPEVPREFRAAWIASVANIDWPSQPGLSTANQKAELRMMMDRMVAMNMNAVILQIRPATDALYLSALEPWSEYLTGEMGKAPEPFYDPLDFAIEEAHKRGLEFHAWFNPFRSLHSSAKSEISADHISRMNPGIVREYGRQQWLDPGSQAAQDHTIRVIIDVVQRYDIDGVHLDDYFYPYKETDSTGTAIDFPDELIWARYSEGMSREDWRRNNVNRFIERLYMEIKRSDPQVRFGISPFGIWRPGFPDNVDGLDVYTEVYADTRRWLRNGWLDYFSPQLYWAINQPGQSYPILLEWWNQQNDHSRHLWPGNYASRVESGAMVNWPASEILNQVEATRQNPNADGNILFSISVLMEDRGGLARALRTGTYQHQALVPASPWLGDTAPLKPVTDLREFGGSAELSLMPADNEFAWLWVIKSFQGNRWDIEIVPGWKHLHNLEGKPEVIVVTAVNRLGIESEPAVIRVN
ncbi:MAG: family 10 glycosylhydrolase [Balneolales bacterium]